MNAGMGGGWSVSGVSHGVCKGDLYVARVAETDKWSIVGEGSMENLSEQGVCSHKPAMIPVAFSPVSVYLPTSTPLSHNLLNGSGCRSLVVSFSFSAQSSCTAALAFVGMLMSCELTTVEIASTLQPSRRKNTSHRLASSAVCLTLAYTLIACIRGYCTLPLHMHRSFR